MNFNSHSNLAGRHSFLSASNYHWINYTEQKLQARWHAHRLAQRGTDLHALAHKCIDMKVKLSKANKTLSMYVADGIGYNMECEQPLYYSDNCFGTPDTISFRRNTLRIHDLKTGLIPASFTQLEVYAALFCLEYGISPWDIDIETRIYQNEEVKVHIPDADRILHIMDRIITFDKQIEIFKEEG